MQFLMANIPFSSIVYLCSASFILQLMNAIGCLSYTKTPLMAKYEGSICISKVLEKSGIFKTNYSITAALRPLNVLWHSLLKTHGLFLFRNLVSAADFVE